jgi:GT2 family glycosyltransferase
MPASFRRVPRGSLPSQPLPPTGRAAVEDRLLTGDVMLVKRAVLGRVGVMDSRLFGSVGDMDIGLGAQRAGFRLVCATGVWLYHEGAGC